MKTEYQIYLVKDDDLLEITEDDLCGNLDEYRADILAAEVIEGALWIRPDNQPEVEVIDELWAIVQELCFKFPCFLSKDPLAPFRYRYTSSEGHLILSPRWPDIEVSSSDNATITVGAVELTEHLYHCGRRFLDLLEKLGDDASALRHHLLPFATEASACLAQLTEAKTP